LCPGDNNTHAYFNEASYNQLKNLTTMKKQEIEQVLLNPDSLKSISARGNEFISSNRLLQSTSEPSSTVRSNDFSLAAQAAVGHFPLNDLRHIRRRARIHGSDTRPNFDPTPPNKTLANSLAQFAKKTSKPLLYKIQDEINRSLIVCSQNDREKLIKNAIGILEKYDKEDAIWTNYYQHANFQGNTAFAWLGGSIYYGILKSYLKGIGLHDAISSFTIDASSTETRGDMILFEHDRYFGRFTSVRTNPAGNTNNTPVSYVGDWINDRTSSLLLVRRYTDEIMAALGAIGVRDQIADQIADSSKLTLRGDPIVTWDMWPTGGDDHPNAPDKRLIQIKVPVEVEVPDWFNYDAEIWLWFYLYINNGDLKGYISHYGAWVEGGIISASVLDGVMETLLAKIPTIESSLDPILDIVNNQGPFEFVYLLPGDHSNYEGRYLEGKVTDDVTVVLQKRRPVIPGTKNQIITIAETIYWDQV
jgi:hypothetical protein